MAKRIVSDKEKALAAELKALETEMKARIKESWGIYFKYIDMEGMYATGKSYDCPCADMHYRGYSYVYPSNEIKRKEKQDREQFLKDSGYVDEADIRKEYWDRLQELRKAISLERYGMTPEERTLRNRIAGIDRKIAELTAAKAELEKELDTL